MRNLRKFMAVILTVVLLASMTVPALAAVKNTEEALKLQAIGLMAGGPADLKLDEPLNRIQGLTFAIRAAGKEAEALAMTDSEVEAVLAYVVDRDKIPNWANGYAQRYVAYAVKNKYTLGTDSTILPKVRFGPMDPISGTSFMVFLMKSGMGYSDVTTANVLNDAIDASIVTASQAIEYGRKPELIRDDAAGILYTAAMSGVNADGKKLIDSLIKSGFVKKQNAIDAGFIKDEEITMTARALDVRTFELQFSNTVDSSKVNINVVMGDKKPAINAIVYSNENKTATIEFNKNLDDGNYVITVTGISDKALTATVGISPSKITSIKFAGEVAIKKGNDITVKVKAEDQYGQDVTSKLNESFVYAAPQGNGVSLSNGVITVKGTDSNTFKIGSTVRITVVNLASEVSESKDFEVAASAQIESISFGEITSDDEDYKDKSIDVTAMTTNAHKYFLPVTMKDRSGNVLSADEIGNVQIYSANPQVVKLDDTAIVDHKDFGTVIKFKDTGYKIDGNAIIVISVPTTGVTATKTIEVVPEPKIDKVTLSAPTGTIKQGSPVVLPVSVVDNFSKTIPLKDIDFSGSGSTLLMNKSTALTAIGGTLSIDRDYATGDTNIMVTPTATNVVITVTTATSKFDHISLTALDASVPKAIEGVESDFASILTNDSSLSTKLEGKVVFKDQYGDKMPAPAYKAVKSNYSSYYYVITKKTGIGSTVFDPSTGTIYSTTTPGTDTYVIELLDQSSKVIDSKEIDIKVIKPSEITSFGVDDLDLFYTDASGISTHRQTITIHGLYDSKRAVINQNMIVNISASNGLTGFDSKTRIYTPVNINTNGEEKAATLTVYINNGDRIIPITKDVVFSDAVPQAKEIIVRYDGAIINTDTVTVPYSELVNKSLLGLSSDSSKLSISAKDQYGVERSITSYNFVVTGNTASGTVSSVGYATGFKAADRGKTFDINIFIDNLYKVLKIVIE